MSTGTGHRQRVEAGIPSGGQFATQTHAEADVSLAPSQPAAPAPAGFEVNEGFAYPQANDLDKVALVVDAVEAGADTNEAIGQALEVSDREGAYYANAAGYLGLVDVDASASVRSYRLTGLGQRMREADAGHRSELMGQIVDQVPDVALVRQDGPEALQGYLQMDGLGQTTATRRAAGMSAWATAVSDRTGLAGALADQHQRTSTRLGPAAERARAQRDEAAQTQSAQTQAGQRPAGFCPSCFVQLPATGVCDECDD